MLYNEVVTETVESTAICQGAVFFKQTDGILRIRTSDGEKSKTKCVTDQRVMLAVDNTRVLLCSPQKAVYVRFGF